MEAIFHEKQEGSLCAQHCLNTLLQGQFFTAVDLAHIGQSLDEQERQHMLEGGVDSREYQHFIEQPSSNFDDSGFFSIQVLQEAVRVWGLELVPYTSQNPIAQDARRDPTTQKAYICNFRQHWFCVRKLGNQWFNLNSLLTGPELISNTYLALFLTQLQQEGYSLFAVVGELAETEADQLLRIIPAVQPIKPSLITPENQDDKSNQDEDTEDDHLQRALAESRRLVEQDDTALQRVLKDSLADHDDTDLQQALNDSMSGGHIEKAANKGGHQLGGTSASKQPSAEEIREKRLAFLEGRASGSSNVTQSPSATSAASGASETSTEEALLQEALRMSMQQP